MTRGPHLGNGREMSPGHTPLQPTTMQGVLKTPSTLSLLISATFCGLRTNFHSVEYRLSSSKPHLRFLTETLVSGVTDCNLYSVHSYYLCSLLYWLLCLCTQRYHLLSCPQFDLSKFSTIWLKVNCQSY